MTGEPFDIVEFFPYIRMNLSLCEGLDAGLSLTRPQYMEMFKGRGLREVKELFRREHVRLGLKDLLKTAEIDRILRELSFLADGVIGRVSELALSVAVDKAGSPPEAPSFCVVALGKLGAEELNYYSDVDLMYIYRTFRGKTSKGKTDLEFYSALFNELTRMLSQHTDGGPIYNVDLRLRPQGRKGLLCTSLEACELYYETFGRTWERAVLLRARGCAGDQGLFNEFWRMITPFVYRKHLDYDSLEEIRKLKDLIDREEAGKKGYNIKTGRGGIREIEFIVHAFLLVFGGRNPWLRVKNTLIALNRLHASGLLGTEEHSILSQAYRFYRRLENRLQMRHCTQTHTLPEDEKELERLALSMGLSSCDELLEKLEFYRRHVRAIFEGVMSSAPSAERGQIYNWEDPSVKRIIEHLTRDGRSRAEAMLAAFISDAAEVANPSMAVKNLADLVGIMRHSRRVFYDLLLENPGFRRALAEVLGNSQYLTRLLITHPELLDELFETEPSRSIRVESAVEKLTSAMKQKGPRGVLERFKLERELKVGIADITGFYNLFRVFHEHTKTAEICIRSLHRHLQPERPMVILGLGKVGSRELTYHSDLDLVLVSDTAQDEMHKGYYTKLINWLPYQVDMRLRPFGSKGIMVSTPRSLEDYFERHGRVWERLAYSRARVLVADDTELASRTLDAVERFVYGGTLDMGKEVMEMRLRLQRELGASPYNIKYSEGGLVDVEFAAQFLSIVHKIMLNSPLAVLSRAAKVGVMDKKSCLTLKENYMFLRRIENALRVLFYPPLKELPNKGSKLTMLSRVLRMNEHDLIDAFMEVKRSNRLVLKELLGV